MPQEFLPGGCPHFKPKTSVVTKQMKREEEKPLEKKKAKMFKGVVNIDGEDGILKVFVKTTN